jgi:hypothetical protein
MSTASLPRPSDPLHLVGLRLHGKASSRRQGRADLYATTATLADNL